MPEDSHFVPPTFTADRDWLHLEARFNYEALDTGSAWVGYNFSGGETVTWELTPMLGAVFGATDGIAPGYKGSLGWKKLEVYSEGEYVVDSAESADSFFYNWSELTLAPLEQFRFGLVTQRTRVRESDREVKRGALLGLQSFIESLLKSKPRFAVIFAADVTAVGLHPPSFDVVG